eukprot:TRINITY_DN2629_c0_g1_i7.p1 TRINITY_DN2629_c0_g1~~TRINITY_DN2629_c0_g1_i7.p1  ORF type:complete len:272 (-),score=33.36 TRINITY_DN2629_c0_g1_i7:298-1113(-)
MSAESWKDRGNQSFQIGEYAQAIECYTNAIKLKSDVAVYFVNRGLSYLRVGDYKRASQDAERAIGLESKSVKAYYILGQAQVELSDLEHGVTSLRKAYHLTEGATTPYAHQICRALRSASKKLWVARQEEADRENVAFFGLLGSKLSIAEKIDLGRYQDSSSSVDLLRVHYAELRSCIDAVPVAQSFTEAPSWMICQLSGNIMVDPVTAPSGITYDRPALLKHFSQNGFVEPNSRRPLLESQLISNLGLREAIDHTLEEFPFLFRGEDSTE